MRVTAAMIERYPTVSGGGLIYPPQADLVQQANGADAPDRPCDHVAKGARLIWHVSQRRNRALASAGPTACNRSEKVWRGESRSFRRACAWLP
jgi:hypothetical protein